MKYTGPTYRPPYEANSLLLQVTVGCTHNKCTFCTMYADVKFSMESLEQIKKDLQEAKQLYGDVKRVFLVNGDAFVLSANRLKPIAKLIIKYFPGVNVITMEAFGDSKLAKDIEIGKFVPATELEVLEEQKTFIERVKVDTAYLGIHGINTIPFDAQLPRDRKNAVKMVDDAIERLDDDFLNSVPERHSI